MNGFIFILWMLCCASWSLGADIFVSPDGDDAHAGTEEFPMRSVEAAVRKAGQGHYGKGCQIILADEVLTPDSSRFWPGDAYEPGRDQASFDKQYVRDWLNANWDRQGNPPHLPQEVIERTSQKYIAAYEKISGKKFEF